MINGNFWRGSTFLSGIQSCGYILDIYAGGQAVHEDASKSLLETIRNTSLSSSMKHEIIIEIKMYPGHTKDITFVKVLYHTVFHLKNAKSSYIGVFTLHFAV